MDHASLDPHHQHSQQQQPPQGGKLPQSVTLPPPSVLLPHTSPGTMTSHGNPPPPPPLHASPHSLSGMPAGYAHSSPSALDASLPKRARLEDNGHAPRQQTGGAAPNFDSKRTYELIVCQQPQRARMCGFGEKDRRPIDPPPIVQLIVRDENGNIDLDTLQNPFFVLHVTLWSEDGREERNIIYDPPRCTRVLMGSLVASPSLLRNPEGEQGCYFVFPDLSIRTDGRYKLKFSLMKLGDEETLTDGNAAIIAQAFSDIFTVYSAKKFPGMTESTELSKAFARQGLKIPIRNDVRSKKQGDQAASPS
ncbi:uncharacterized protein VTP21DRAFT_10093 [Calcarisporiella thermophila]|uniref:uncharacterized protein n=1 Tax=Calcarisporiella thermophila TaxID=911321 RepID=UPI0037449CE5